jgi:hypothetical protein
MENLGVDGILVLYSTDPNGTSNVFLAVTEPCINPKALNKIQNFTE